jgi:hypothetical protein
MYSTPMKMFLGTYETFETTIRKPWENPTSTPKGQLLGQSRRLRANAESFSSPHHGENLRHPKKWVPDHLDQFREYGWKEHGKIYKTTKGQVLGQPGRARADEVYNFEECGHLCLRLSLVFKVLGRM